MNPNGPDYRLNPDKDPTKTAPGDTLPGVTADHTGTTLPKHIPVRPSGKCSIMCDHPDIDRDADHQAAVDSWVREAARRAS